MSPSQRAALQSDAADLRWIVLRLAALDLPSEYGPLASARECAQEAIEGIEGVLARHPATVAAVAVEVGS